MLTSHLLSCLVVTPLAGVALIALARRARPAAARAIAVLTSLLGLGLSASVWLRYDPAGPPYQLLEQGQAVTQVGAAYVVGADGLTVMAVVVIEVVGLLAILASWSGRAGRNPVHYAGLLILQVAMLGVVMSLDAILFAAWWAVLLTTVAVTTASGRPARWRTIALVTASVVALLAGILLIHAAAGDATGVLSFDLAKLQQVSLPPGRQLRPLLALCAAFATAAVLLTLGTKAPRTPGHAALVMTALVLLPAYGLVRFNLAILPQAARAFVPGMAALAMATLLMAAVGAWRTRDASRILTWAAVGQLAVILLGLTVIDPQALAGSLLQCVAVALALAPLAVLGRSSERSRVVVAGAWILTLAAVGLPGLIAFTGGAGIVRGTSHAHPLWALGAAAGLVVIAAAMLRATRLTLSEPMAQATSRPGARAAMALGFAALAVLMASAPEPVRARLQPTMARVITRLDAGYAAAFASVPGCGAASLPAPSAPAGFTAIAPCGSAATSVR